MTEYGIHASHEQIPPAELLAAMVAAERAGFDAAMCSDHFSPWSGRQGESAFAWSWLGAALQATNLSFGVVNAPGQRYHPAIIAQAIGTLSAMYPGRFWAALGSGEFSNEHITGEPWPRKDVREARLLESVGVIRDPAGGPGGHPRRPGQGGPGPAVDPARGGPAADRRGGQHEDRGLVRRLGRRPGHGERARGAAALDDLGLPGRRRERPDLPAGASELGADPARGRGDRPRPVAEQHLPATGVLGPRDGRALRRRVRET